MRKICVKRNRTGRVRAGPDWLVIADFKRFRGHGLRQGHEGVVEAPAVVKAKVGEGGSADAVRHGEGDAGSFPLVGLRRDNAAVALGDAPAEGQAQPQALGCGAGCSAWW